MSSIDPLSFTINIAQKAGDVLLQFFGTELTHSIKTHENDFATEADIAAEQLVIAAIRESFPDDAILAEESGASGNANSEYTWIIDPLDGTLNFAQNNKDFGVMIARARESEVELAVIFNPIKQLLAYAQKGQGTFLNEKRILLTDSFHTIEDMRASVSALPGFQNEEVMVKLKTHVQSLNVYTPSLRSAAANTLAMLSGHPQAYIINGFFAWDFVPPDLLLREAGMTVTDLQGKSIYWDADCLGFIAAPASVHAQLLALIEGKKTV